MSVVYIVIVFLVTVLLLAIPLFPFWKVASVARKRHPALWMEYGPADIRTFLAYPGMLLELPRQVAKASKDKSGENPAHVAIRRDSELIKWTRMALEVRKIAPKSFIGQIGAVIVFLWFLILFTNMIGSIVGVKG